MLSCRRVGRRASAIRRRRPSAAATTIAAANNDNTARPPPQVRGGYEAGLFSHRLRATPHLARNMALIAHATQVSANYCKIIAE